jgi:uncharacterized protein (TIGR00369 family)
MTLTDNLIRKTKPSDAPIRLSDGAGMYLLLNPNGSRWWRFDYRLSGMRKTLSFGTYPDTGLKLAREHRDNARKLLASGVDPSAKRQAEKVAGVDAFESVAREWFAKFAPGWAKGHSDKVIRRLETNLFPWIGSKAIASIEAPELLACLQRIERRGALDTAHRAHQNSGQIFRYAVATGRAQRDPSADLRGALPPARHSHYATITEPARVGELLRAIDGYRGSFVIGTALRLAPLAFTRPGELRNAQWSEFDLDNAEWRIPAERMKSRVKHVVPLSKQAVAILRELQPKTQVIRPPTGNTAAKRIRANAATRDECAETQRLPSGPRKIATSIPEGFTPLFRTSPALELIGPIYCKTASDDLAIGMHVGAKHCNGRGTAHGGILATLADVALGYTIAFSTNPPTAAVTINLTLDYAGTAKLGDWLEAKATIQKHGSRFAFANCYIAVGEERIVRASAVFAIAASKAVEPES